MFLILALPLKQRDPLQGLDHLTTIGGNLSTGEVMAASQGLNHLTTAGDYLEIQLPSTSLQDLENLTTVMGHAERSDETRGLELTAPPVVPYGRQG